MSAVRFINALLVDTLATAFFLARLRTLTKPAATPSMDADRAKRGRPKKDATLSPAERQRACRERKRLAQANAHPGPAPTKPKRKPGKYADPDARRAYRAEWMRKRRAAAKAGRAG